jgi:hypothetical protein
VRVIDVRTHNIRNKALGLEPQLVHVGAGPTLAVPAKFVVGSVRASFDPGRRVGSGLSELDTGIRIRYEFTRKFAPYIGFAYTGQYGPAAGLVRGEGGIANDPRFVFGIRLWY